LVSACKPEVYGSNPGENNYFTHCFEDAEELLAEDESKQVCRRYMNTGQCQFGDACRYSHMTPEVRLQLRAQGIATLQYISYIL